MVSGSIITPLYGRLHRLSDNLDNGDTPLVRAVYSRNSSFFKLFKKHGGNLNKLVWPYKSFPWNKLNILDVSIINYCTESKNQLELFKIIEFLLDSGVSPWPETLEKIYNKSIKDCINDKKLFNTLKARGIAIP